MIWHVWADCFFRDVARDFLMRFPYVTCHYDPSRFPVQKDDVLVYLGMVFDSASLTVHLQQLCRLLRRFCPFIAVRVVLFSCFDPATAIPNTATRQDIEAVIDSRSDIAKLYWMGLGGDGTGLDGEMIRCVLSTLQYVIPEPSVIAFTDELTRSRWQPHADEVGRPCMLLSSPDIPWKHQHVLLIDYTGSHIEEFADLKLPADCRKSIYVPFVRRASPHYADMSLVMYQCVVPYLHIPTLDQRYVKLYVTQLFASPAVSVSRMSVILSSDDPETHRAILSLFDERKFRVQINTTVSQSTIFERFQRMEEEHPDANVLIVESQCVANNQLETRFAMRFCKDKPVVRIQHPEKNFLPSLEDTRLTAWMTIPPMPLDQYTMDLYHLVNGTTHPITCYRMVTEREDVSDATIYFRLTGRSKAWAIHEAFQSL